jgi:hypothetical protein
MWKLAALFSMVIMGANAQPILDPIGAQEVHTESVTISAQSGQMILQWDPSSNPVIAGYKVYWGYAHRSYSGSLAAGSSTAVNISGLQPGKMYYFTSQGMAGRIGEPLFE